MIRRHYADEEPDSDEIERSYWEFEGGDLTRGTCSRCGHSDHRARECTNCPPETGERRRRTRAEQIAATEAARRITP